MTFPTVEGRAVGASAAANVTSHAITLPLSGSAIGDLLVVAFSSDANETTAVLSGSNWLKAAEAVNGTACTGAIYTKRCQTTSEALVLQTTTEQTSHISWRIRGASGAVVVATAATGTNNSTDPPSCDPARGARDFLWIATRHGDAAVCATAAPANYSSFTVSSGPGSSGATTASAERALNAATENPGTFTCNSEDWVSFTIAIVPTADVAASDKLYTVDPNIDRALLNQKYVLESLALPDFVTPLLRPMVGKVTWAQLSTPLASGGQQVTRDLSDGFQFVETDLRMRELLQREGLLKNDARFSEQLTLTQDAPYLSDVQMKGMDAVKQDAPLLADGLIEEHLPQFLDLLLLGDMGAGSRELTLSDLMLLKDYFFIENERKLIDGLLLADSVDAAKSTVTDFLVAVMDGLFIPDVDMRVSEHGQWEMLLSVDAIVKALEAGKLDQLMLADAFLRALMPIGKVTWAQMSVGAAAGGTVYNVSIMDGMQFFDPDSTKAQESTQRDFMFIAEQRYADLALQRLTGLVLDDVVDSIVAGLRLLEFTDGLLLPDARTFEIGLAFLIRLLLTTVPLVRTWDEHQTSDSLLFSDSVSFGFSVREIQVIDNLLLSASELIKEQSMITGREGLLLSDIISIITGTELLRSVADGLQFNDSRSSELLRGLLVYVMLDSLKTLEREHADRDSVLMGEAVSMIRELIRTDYLLTVESLIEALRIASGVLEQISTDNLMFGEERRSDLLKTVIVGLLLDSVSGKSLDRAAIRDSMMFADSYARGIDALRMDEILLGEVTLFSREALWSDGLVFSETFERRIIAYLISHLTWARLGFGGNFLGIVLRSQENFLGAGIKNDANFLGVVLNSVDWEVSP